MATLQSLATRRSRSTSSSWVPEEGHSCPGARCQRDRAPRAPGVTKQRGGGCPMPGEDLMSIPGLQEVHQRALARKLGITSLRALADADQRAIYAALGSIRPRPSLTRIA